jgi:hypothetical protein
MHTPVALLVDFYSGWSFPRHLYSGDVYRVWGNRPYEAGDYLTDAVLDLLYPGYQNSSYFHDESGFLTATPYGDMADCLLSDAPLWALDRYAVVIVAGELSGGREVRDKLQAYAERGGHVVITAGNLAKLPGGLAGITNASGDATMGKMGRMGGMIGGMTNVSGSATVGFGRGRVTVFASPFGVEPDATVSAGVRSETDKPLPKPFKLAPDVRLGLEAILRLQQLFAVQGEGLSLIICRKSPGEFTIGIASNRFASKHSAAL